MRHTPIGLSHKIKQALKWYGTEYTFKRKAKNDFGEPTLDPVEIQKVLGLYHTTRKEFIALLSTDGATLKTKTNKGILCSAEVDLKIKQGDIVVTNAGRFKVAAIENLLFGDFVIAQEISIEEVI